MRAKNERMVLVYPDGEERIIEPHEPAGLLRRRCRSFCG
jgi:virulence-associated protein VagC